MNNSAPHSASSPATAGAVDVYWRPGCPFCSRLLGALEQASVKVELFNIWQDDEARAFVRAHNRGNETVPTVAVGDLVVTNPDPRAFVEVLRSNYGHLLGNEQAARESQR